MVVCMQGPGMKRSAACGFAASTNAALARRSCTAAPARAAARGSRFASFGGTPTRRRTNRQAHTRMVAFLRTHAGRVGPIAGPERRPRRAAHPRRLTARSRLEAARALITLRHGPAALFNASSRRCGPSSCSSASFYSSRNAKACWANTDVTFPASCSCTVEECEFVVAVLARER